MSVSRTKIVFLLLTAIAGGLVLALAGGQTAGAQGGDDASAGPVVYASDKQGNYDIYTLDPDTGLTTQLTDDPATDIDPVWSPDGSYIAFVSDRDGDFELYVMLSDGSDVLQLTNNNAEDSQPRWQPDGIHITYISDVNGQPDVYVISFTTGLVRQLTNDRFDERGPNFGATPGGAVNAATPFPTQGTPTPDAVVTSARLNVRENPGEGADILTSVGSGTTLDIVGRRPDNAWLQVIIPGNITGWVFADLVQVNIDLNTVPVVNAPYVAAPPTATPSPVPPTTLPVIISFTVDRDTITVGQCVTFTWVTQGINSVFYQGQGVVGNATRQECPAATTTFNLSVIRTDGLVDNRYITITVNP